MIFEEKLIESVKIYEGRILNVRLDKVTTVGGTSYREVIEHSGAAAAVAIDDDDEVILVKQFRYPAGRAVLEIPAGKIDPGEDDPAKTMIRELKEETGYTASHVEYLGCVNPSVGYSEEKIYIYLMRGLVPGDQELDTDEAVEVIKMPFDEIYEKARSGELEDAKTIAALFFAGSHMGRS